MCNANAFESFFPEDAKPALNVVSKVFSNLAKKKDKKIEEEKIFNEEALEKFNNDKSLRIDELNNSLNVSRNSAKESYLEDVARRSSSGVKYSENLVNPTVKTVARLKYKEDDINKRAKQDISRLEKEYEKNKFLYIKKK